MSQSYPLSNDQPAADRPQLLVKDIGRQDYVPVWRAMQQYTDQRDASSPDQLWLVEHPPVFTQGQAGKSEHVLAAGDIPVIQVDRGGQVTYHGPGQIVAYPLLDIRRQKLPIRKLVQLLEQALIQTLLEFDVIGARKPNAPGIYVDGAKIASLGLRVRKGCTFHGLAFNIDMDLEPFGRINPCGYQGLEVTQLSAFGPADINQVKSRLVRQLSGVLGYNADPIELAGSGFKTQAK